MQVARLRPLGSALERPPVIRRISEASSESRLRANAWPSSAGASGTSTRTGRVDACGGAQWSRAVFPALPSSSVKQFRLYEITIIALLVLLAAYYRGETQIQGIVQTV